jgi:hypothetical protein
MEFIVYNRDLEERENTRTCAMVANYPGPVDDLIIPSPIPPLSNGSRPSQYIFSTLLHADLAVHPGERAKLHHLSVKTKEN